MQIIRVRLTPTIIAVLLMTMHSMVYAADPLGTPGTETTPSPAGDMAPRPSATPNSTRTPGNPAATINEKATGERSIGVRSTGKSTPGTGYQNEPGIAVPSTNSNR